MEIEQKAIIKAAKRRRILLTSYAIVCLSTNSQSIPTSSRLQSALRCSPKKKPFWRKNSTRREFLESRFRIAFGVAQFHASHANFSKAKSISTKLLFSHKKSNFNLKQRAAEKSAENENSCRFSIKLIKKFFATNRNVFNCPGPSGKLACGEVEDTLRQSARFCCS